tara:strand:- start:520 stop:669 length:150 start_codon:yes stop_codon:yes gene_type:complete
MKGLLDEQSMIEELIEHYGEGQVQLLVAQAKTDFLIDLYNDIPNGKIIS